MLKKLKTKTNETLHAWGVNNTHAIGFKASELINQLQHLNAITWAFMGSLVIHATLLSLHFNIPEKLDRVFQNNNLPLILVNVRLKAETNTHAQAIAQSNLSGGGEDSTGRMSSPLLSARRTVDAQDAEDLERQESALKSLQAEQSRLLTQIKTQLASLGPVQPHPLSPDQESKRQRLLQMLAEIEARIDQTNKRPHKRYFSPSTRQSEFALYYDEMRQKIENYGTQNFPSLQGRRLYGSLTMVVTVNAIGQVLSVQVLEGSGKPELDRRAQAIVMSSGPFAAFGPALLSKADQVALVSKFTFTESGTLNTESK